MCFIFLTIDWLIAWLCNILAEKADTYLHSWYRWYALLIAMAFTAFLLCLNFFGRAIPIYILVPAIAWPVAWLGGLLAEKISQRLHRWYQWCALAAMLVLTFCCAAL